MNARLYLGTVAALVIAVVTAIILANASVDPYGLRNPTRAQSDRDVVPEARPGEFVRKALQARAARARTVILGTSRADRALSVDHPGFAPEDQPVFNLAMGAAHVDQIRLLLMHAQSISPLRRAVISLDLESFIGDGRPDFDATALAGNPESQPLWLSWLRLNLSRETFVASARTLWPSHDEAPGATDRAEVRPSRADHVGDNLLKETDGQRGLVWATELNNFLARLPELFPRWSPGTTWSSEPKRKAAIASFGQILRYARQHRIDLRLFISPVHARYLEWYRRVGWWPMFEAWKRALVAEIAAEAREYPGSTAFALWDLSGYHGPALESVPRLGDRSSRMRWYLETSHYSGELGRLVLDRVLDQPLDDALLWTDARIDSESIERHLNRTESDGERYRIAQAGESHNVGVMVSYLRRIARR